MSEPQRNSWGSRLGFVLAAVGAAVGLGNVWRFPFQAGEEGGAAFVLVYVAFVFGVGLPALLVEFVVGRRTNLNPVGATRTVAGGRWRYIGWLMILGSSLVLSYYSVVAGVTIRYTAKGVAGGYAATGQAAGEQFTALSTGLDALALHAVFMATIVGIVALGVRRGIERAAKAIVFPMVAILLGLAAYASTLPGAGEAYSYYLSPDFGTVAENWDSILPAAAGQAFFTLALAGGTMLTYASYIGEDRNLAEDGALIAGANVGISFVVGLAVFPMLFTAGVPPADPGPGAIFVSLATAFSGLPAGDAIGTVFFGMVALGAISSGISILEVAVSYLVDEHGIRRPKAAVGVGCAVFVLGVPTSFETIFLELLDGLASEVLLVLTGLLLTSYVGWKLSDAAKDEISKGIGEVGGWGDVWIWAVRLPVFAVLVTSLVLGLVGYVGFLTTDFTEYLFG